MLRKSTSLLWTARKRLKLVWKLLQDERVPMWQKAIPFLPLIYIFSPLNFLTLAIPLVGQVDDVLIVMFTLDLLEKVVDDEILAEHQTDAQ